jgi:hypothetical protein
MLEWVFPARLGCLQEENQNLEVGPLRGNGVEVLDAKHIPCYGYRPYPNVARDRAYPEAGTIVNFRRE